MSVESSSCQLPRPGQLIKLQKARTPVKYAHEVIPELAHVSVEHGKEISTTRREATKWIFLKMVQECFNSLVEARRGSERQWPPMLKSLSKFQDEFDNVFYEGSVLIPKMRFHGYETELDMHRVPLFMEWETDTDRTCRVLVNPRKEQFYVMHLHYSEEDGCKAPAGMCEVDGIFSFTMSDLLLVGREKTIDAAFTPLKFDTEGQVCQTTEALHDSYIPYGLCH